MVRSRFARPATAFHSVGPKFKRGSGRLHGTASKGPTARVLTYNVHRWLGTDRQIAPGRIAEVIASCEPDIVALQEVRVGRVPDRGASTRPPRLRRGSEWNSISSRPSGSSASSSASPSSRAIRRDACARAGCRASPPGRPSRSGAPCGFRSRSAGRELQVVNAHLSLRSRERLNQAEALIGSDWIGHPECGDPAVLLGDFNAPPHSRSYRLFASRLRDAQLSHANGEPQATFHTRAPVLRLDHVFVTPSVEVGGRRPRADAARPDRLRSLPAPRRAARRRRLERRSRGTHSGHHSGRARLGGCAAGRAPSADRRSAAAARQGTIDLPRSPSAARQAADRRLDASPFHLHHRQERSRPARRDPSGRSGPERRCGGGGFGLDRRHPGAGDRTRRPGDLQPVAGLRSAEAVRRGSVPRPLAAQSRCRRGRAADLKAEIAALFKKGEPDAGRLSNSHRRNVPRRRGSASARLCALPRSGSTARTRAAIPPSLVHDRVELLPDTQVRNPQGHHPSPAPSGPSAIRSTSSTATRISRRSTSTQRGVSDSHLAPLRRVSGGLPEGLSRPPTRGAGHLWFPHRHELRDLPAPARGEAFRAPAPGRSAETPGGPAVKEEIGTPARPCGAAQCIMN